MPDIPPGWDADLWFQFRAGCIADGIGDPAVIRRLRREAAQAEEAAYADYCAEAEAEMQLQGGTGIG